MNASLSTVNDRLSSVIPAPPASRPRWALTQEAFDRLLASLGGDRESAGKHYLETRAKLVRFFEWRGCPFPEDHADETINRVARRLVEGEKILNQAGYFFGVARMLLLEINKESIRQQQALKELPGSTITSNQSDESEACIDCLRHCLQKLSPDDRELILQYYHGEKGVKIDCRKKLAERFGVPINTLRMRVFRIRENLQRCLENCQTQCRSKCTNRSLVDHGPRWADKNRRDKPTGKRVLARYLPERFDQERKARVRRLASRRFDGYQ
jgi:DNA-directed RNA polymerase specialized sigma24 family protein